MHNYQNNIHLICSKQNKIAFKRVFLKILLIAFL